MEHPSDPKTLKRIPKYKEQESAEYKPEPYRLVYPDKPSHFSEQEWEKAKEKGGYWEASFDDWNRHTSWYVNLKPMWSDSNIQTTKNLDIPIQRMEEKEIPRELMDDVNKDLIKSGIRLTSC